MIDFSVKTVVNVFSHENLKWHREQHAPRNKEGIVLFLSGSITYCFDHQTITAKKGDILLLPGDLPYHGVRNSETVSMIVIDYLLEENEKEGVRAFPSPMVYETPGEILFPRFKKLLSSWECQENDVLLQGKAFVYDVIATLLRSGQQEDINDNTRQIMDYIREHIGEATLNLQTLCAYFFISESQLRRNIRHATGLSPNAYIKTLRMNRAKNLLLYSKDTIKDISASCGFSSPYYFSQCFHEFVGQSPQAFRMQE